MENITNRLKIQLYGSPILRKKCRKVSMITPEIKKYLEEMELLMHLDQGAGLAANQAGLDLSLVVIHTPQKKYRLINPRIIRRSGKIKFEEGCLSFPGISLTVRRSSRIKANFMNEKGESVDLETGGVLAVILQHEIDHINGVLFIDRVSVLQRLKVGAQLNKIKMTQRKTASGR